MGDFNPTDTGIVAESTSGTNGDDVEKSGDDTDGYDVVEKADPSAVGIFEASLSGTTEHVEKSEDTGYDTGGKTLLEENHERVAKGYEDAVASALEDAEEEEEEIEMASMGEIFKAAHNPEEYREEQERKKLAERVADELEERAEEKSDRRTVSKGTGTTDAVEACKQAEEELEEVADMVRELKA
jgi:hypothetical protein